MLEREIRRRRQLVAAHEPGPTVEVEIEACYPTEASFWRMGWCANFIEIEREIGRHLSAGALRVGVEVHAR